MRFIDVHTHLLPEIDDGAKDMNQTMQMIEMLKNQGISEVFLTPHFYHFKTTIEAFCLKRQESLNLVKNIFDENKIKFHLGAEVYLIDTLFVYDDISALCIGDSNLVLVELPFETTSVEKIYSMINKLCANYSVRPIIAHIERYPAYFNENVLSELNKMDCLIQFDIQSLKNFFLRKKIQKFVKNGLIHLAGSDCHDSVVRKPDYVLLNKFFLNLNNECLLNKYIDVKKSTL